MEKRFLENFGNVAHLNGPLGVRFVRIEYTPPPIVLEFLTKVIQGDRLWIADPAALNHILHKSGYVYAKPNHVRERAGLFTGQGLVWANGEFPAMMSSFSLPARLTIPQVKHISVRGGQWLRRLDLSRPRGCCRVSWIPQTRQVGLVYILISKTDSGPCR